MSIEQDPQFIIDPKESYTENFQRYHRFLKAEREVYIKYYGSDEDPMHCPKKAKDKFDTEVWYKWINI